MRTRHYFEAEVDLKTLFVEDLQKLGKYVQTSLCFRVVIEKRFL